MNGEELFEQAKSNNFNFDTWGNMNDKHILLILQRPDVQRTMSSAIEVISFAQIGQIIAYPKSLPPCACVLSSSDLASLCLETHDRTIFHSDVYTLLERAGYWDWIRAKEPKAKHDLMQLATYFSLTLTNANWYVVPHYCRPWNCEVGILLAQCMHYGDAHENDWNVVDVEEEEAANDDDVGHCSVYSPSRDIYFDLLAWAGV